MSDGSSYAIHGHRAYTTRLVMTMKTKTITKYFHQLTDGREVELPSEPGTDEITEITKDGEVLLGFIERDNNAQNPRKEFDSVGKMVCWHRSYDLGDEQPSESPEDYRRKMAYEQATFEQRELFDRLENDVFDEGEEVPDEAALVEKILSNRYVILPLYLYDHGGITMRAAPFYDPWDSGQVGFIFVSKKRAESEWGTGFYKTTEGNINRTQTGAPIPDEEAWAYYLRGEVETYDQYLTGDVLGVCIWTYDAKTLELKDRDECWGYYGQTYAETELKEKLG